MTGTAINELLSQVLYQVLFKMGWLINGEDQLLDELSEFENLLVQIQDFGKLPIYLQELMKYPTIQ